ncbi:MAG: dual specificity protein phosphatase family protein [Planctomycetota bacterium]
MSTTLDRWYSRLVFWPTWAWNIALGRVLKLRPWWSEIDSQVLLGARPFRSDLQILRAAGVTAIVNTCEEFSGFHSENGRLGIRQLSIPTIDFTHPSREDIDHAIDFIDKEVAAGNKVYIHCKAGRGRSGTVAICWLMHSRGMSLDEAQRHLLNCRPHVNPRLTERPVVRRYAEDLRHPST